MVTTRSKASLPQPAKRRKISRVVVYDSEDEESNCKSELPASPPADSKNIGSLADQPAEPSSGSLAKKPAEPKHKGSLAKKPAEPPQGATESDNESTHDSVPIKQEEEKEEEEEDFMDTILEAECQSDSEAEEDEDEDAEDHVEVEDASLPAPSTPEPSKYLDDDEIFDRRQAAN